MKDSRYLTHDLGSRNDPKLIELQMEMGGTGLAIWWCVVEMLWENEGYIPFNPRSIAYSLPWATPEEVNRVLTEFDLFENDGELVWSKSALERITRRDEQTTRMREGGRKGGQGRRKSGEATLEGGLEATPEATLEGRVEAINDINDINDINETYYSAPASAGEKEEEIFLIFFSRNFADPAGETKRFFDYYTANGWKWGNNRPIKDVSAVARQWKPKNASPRFDADALKWYQGLCAGISEAHNDLFTRLVDLKKKGTSAMLRYNTPAMAERARKILGGCDAAKGMNITWKFNN